MGKAETIEDYVWHLCNLRTAPEKPGVYILLNIDKNEVVVEYIGQSKNIKKRLGSHKRNFYVPENENCVAVMCISDYAERIIFERQLIRSLDPIWNDQRY